MLAGTILKVRFQGILQTMTLQCGLQDAAKKAELRMGVYVRVHGHLRVIDGQKSVVAFNMRPITDFNEVRIWPS